MERIEATEGIEGITLLGGEPLQQAEAVLELIMACKEKELTVFLYTGYEPEEFDQTMQACFDSSDIAVTGRYEQTLRNTSLQWRGSENQKVHFIGDRYSRVLIDEGNYIEIHIDGSGSLDAFGYCEKPFFDGLSDMIG